MFLSLSISTSTLPTQQSIKLDQYQQEPFFPKYVAVPNPSIRWMLIAVTRDRDSVGRKLIEKKISYMPLFVYSVVGANLYSGIWSYPTRNIGWWGITVDSKQVGEALDILRADKKDLDLIYLMEAPKSAIQLFPGPTDQEMISNLRAKLKEFKGLMVVGRKFPTVKGENFSRYVASEEPDDPTPTVRRLERRVNTLLKATSVTDYGGSKHKMDWFFSSWRLGTKYTEYYYKCYVYLSTKPHPLTKSIDSTALPANKAIGVYVHAFGHWYLYFQHNPEPIGK